MTHTPTSRPPKHALFLLLFFIICIISTLTFASTGTINYSYDNTHQLTGAVFANSTSSVTYSYDKSGNRITYTENAPDHGTPSASVSSSIDQPAKPYIGPTQNVITGRGYGAGIQQIEISTDGGKTWFVTGVTDTSDAGTGPWAKWSFTWTTLPADGKYYIMSRATSTTNEVEIPVNVLTVYVDKTAPTNTITYPKNGMVLAGGSCTFTGTADDGLGVGIDKVEISMDNGVHWMDATDDSGQLSDWSKWKYIASITANNPYVILSRAVDLAGNIEGAPQRVATACSSVWGWGYNDNLQIGIDSSPYTVIKFPKLNNNLDGVISLATGRSFSLALKADGTVWSWGRSYYGELGRGFTNSYVYITPTQVKGIDGIGNLNNVKAIACGESHAIAVLQDGTVVAWGYNDCGQLGLGDQVDKNVPKKIQNFPPEGVSIVSVAADSGSSFALDSNGNVWTWGGVYGLGGRTIPEGSNAFVPGILDNANITNATKIACASMVAMVVKDDGSVWSWGYGALGNGSVSSNPKQVKQKNADGTVTNFTNAISAAHSYSHAMILKSDGSVWTCGSNDVGQLGQGTVGVGVDYPTQVTGITNAVSISAHMSTSAVLTNNGNIYAFGSNTQGQLGINSTGGYTITPTLVHGPNNIGALTNVKSFAESCGTDYHFLVFKKTGPSSSLTQPLNTSYINSVTYTIKVNATDDGVNGIKEVDVSVDNGSSWYPATYTLISGNVSSWEYTWNIPGNGPYSIRTKAIDQLGNEESPDAVTTVTVDTTPAEVGIKNPAENTIIRGTNYTVEGFSDDGIDSGVSNVQVSTNGGTSWCDVSDVTPGQYNKPLALWNSTWTLSADGQYTLEAKATDVAGNISYSAVQTVTVDNITPSSSIIAPTNTTTITGSSYTITGSADDGTGSGVQKVEVSTNGGTSWNLATGTDSWSYTWYIGSPGPHQILSRATDNAGNVETPGTGITVNVPAIGSPELQHFNWDESLSGGNCTYCHTTANTFVASGFRNDNSFCYSCHNAAGMSHEKGLYGNNHSIMVNATTGGAKMPTYGTITTSEYNNQPYSRLNASMVVCVTCHNSMRKSEDMGRTWEYTTTTDNRTYTMQNGGWTGYRNIMPKVYRDTSLWAGPTYSKTKKNYLVDPSEYTYNEDNGTVTFLVAQSPTSYVYVSLDYPYLRASNAGNTLCSDCHTQATHLSDNCQTCHAAHNTFNIKGVKGTLRAPNRTSVTVKFLRYTGVNSFADGNTTRDGICEVCHTQTKYYRRDGSGFTNHSGSQNYDRMNCTICHRHKQGFAKYTSISQGQQAGGGLSAPQMSPDGGFGSPNPLEGYSM